MCYERFSKLRPTTTVAKVTAQEFPFPHPPELFWPKRVQSTPRYSATVSRRLLTAVPAIHLSVSKQTLTELSKLDNTTFQIHNSLAPSHSAL
jgi:hypothetical protein